VSHLGHAPVTPDPAALPAGIDPARPLFLTLGTIEPRKNHALLLDVWERLAARRGAAGMPLLAIVGRRGWNNAAVFDRLDRLRHDGAAVREIAGLPDGGVAALMARARALLFPSRAEGFGLPLVEAMAAGLPALCAPLPVFAEIAGDYPVYLEADDVYSWTDTIDRMSSGGGQGILMAPDRRAVPHIVSWDEHINRALGAMG
jgi:glycosyltransferase involved in cell wall biosynthesis